MQTTDTPMSVEDAAASLLEPIATEEETEAEEAPQEETEAEEVETEDDASEVEDEKDDEVEAEAEADDDEEESDDDHEQSDTLYTVKVDGEERQVTLDELTRGFSGQAYIQKGMEANKAQEKALAEQAQTLQQQNEYILQLYNQAQQSGFTPPPQLPDAALAQTDPIAYLEAKASYDEQLAKHNAEQEQLQYLQQQRDREMQDQRRAALAETERRLVEAMPELREPEKAKQFQEDLKAASATYGFSQQELQQIVTHYPSVKALADAAKWRNLQAKKKAAKEPRETPKSVTKPKAKSQTDSKRKAAQELKRKAVKSQSNEAWAEMLLNSS